jgi:hypothetical protein
MIVLDERNRMLILLVTLVSMALIFLLQQYSES